LRHGLTVAGPGTVVNVDSWIHRQARPRGRGAAGLAANRFLDFFGRAPIVAALRVTPAMEAGVSDHVWSIEEIVGLLETHGESN
jgi:hypothetical protein